MSPPPGVIPNFRDAPNLDVFVVLTITLCVSFATVAVLLRMYTKVFILRAVAWEDCKLIRAIGYNHRLTLFRYHRPSMGEMVR